MQIVAGGAGFIGTNLIKELIKKGEEIVCIDNLSLGSVANLPKYDKLKFLECDISNLQELRSICEKWINRDKELKIWHMAANSDIPAGISDPEIDFKNTFLTTKNLISLSEDFEFIEFNFASSSAVYGYHPNVKIKENTGPCLPTSNYGAAKLASEALLSSFASIKKECKTNIFRFPNVVGNPATHGVIFDFINKLKSNKDILNVLGNGSQKKSYLYVKDLINGMLKLSSTEIENNRDFTSPCQIFNLGPNDNGITVKEIAEAVCAHYNPNAKIIFGESPQGWPGDIPTFMYDCSKANSLKWQPIYNSHQAVNLTIREIIEKN
tara:strand:+ start:724 stop:1692 length:969 start_codon:yes stop_codon:yes gene_type:complete